MKKLLMILCMITSILSMTAVANASSETQSYNGYTEDDFKSNSESLYTSISGFTDDELKQYMESDDAIISEAVKSWSEIKDDLGDYVEIGDFSINENKGTITTVLKVNYSKRDLILTVVYDENLSVTSITTDKEYTIGETMKKAGLNTIMGMGTVFVILILISTLISLFSYINKWEEKMKNKKKVNQLETTTVSRNPVIEEKVEELVDDLEVVAAISAALAASMNTSIDGFVVRSIKRRTTKTR
ncbi:OadG family transporter subunit [Lachnotalea glycerini]|nr:OadG family transporter subunit [Lachnotalea glycerini]